MKRGGTSGCRYKWDITLALPVSRRADPVPWREDSVRVVSSTQSLLHPSYLSMLLLLVTCATASALEDGQPAGARRLALAPGAANVWSAAAAAASARAAVRSALGHEGRRTIRVFDSEHEPRSDFGSAACASVR